MKDDLRDIWKGQTVACIASGPSLTLDDVEAVRDAGLKTIVTNTTYRIAPWADILFGMDSRWWAAHADEVKAFAGMRYAAAPGAVKAGARSLYGSKWFVNFGNSGAGAIGIACHAGARRILLLGYDCQKSGSLVHWHGDHTSGLGNANSMKLWPGQFARAAAHAAMKGTHVVNCSKSTALKCFERGQLSAELLQESAELPA